MTNLPAEQVHEPADMNKKVDQVVTDLNNICVLLANHQGELTSFLCDLGVHFESMKDLHLSSCHVSQTLLNFMLANENRRSASNVAGAEGALSKTDYDLLLKLYSIKCDLVQQGLTIDARHLEMPADYIQARRVSLQPSVHAAAGPLAKTNIKMPSEDYHDEGEDARAPLGQDPTRLTVESTLHRNAPLKHQYKHSAQDSLELEGSVKTIPGRPSNPDGRAQEYAGADLNANLGLLGEPDGQRTATGQ